MKYCIDCLKSISRIATRCKSCKAKKQFKEYPEKHYSFGSLNNPKYKDGRAIKPHFCIDCGKKISRGGTRCMKCASKIFVLTHSKEKHPSWKGGDKIKNCIVCGKEFIVKIAHFNARKTCSRKCAGVRHKIRFTGSNHPSWRGGGHFSPYTIKWTKTFREKIRYRDNYKCQVCEKLEIKGKRKLSVHHIDYTKNNLDPNNLITLCDSCHNRTTLNRNWYYYFKGGCRC